MNSEPVIAPKLLVSLSLLFLLTGLGCRSMTQPGSASFASVTIENRSAAEIAAATVRVFEADGYRGGRAGPSKMIFEKEASQATSYAREGLAAGAYGQQTINRVRVDIVPLSESSHRLQCKAFMITGGSDPFFQDEVPLSNLRRGPYQSLLNKVAKEFK